MWSCQECLWHFLWREHLLIWAPCILQVSAPLAALIYTAEPLWGALFAWGLLGERWGPQGWVGAGLIVSASLAAQLTGNKDHEKTAWSTINETLRLLSKFSHIEVTHNFGWGQNLLKLNFGFNCIWFCKVAHQSFDWLLLLSCLFSNPALTLLVQWTIVKFWHTDFLGIFPQFWIYQPGDLAILYIF